MDMFFVGFHSPRVAVTGSECMWGVVHEGCCDLMSAV